ncbi:hypothetical protein CLPUN_14620 [Clostridium puniceum]|uniref:Uncharacterized protein n=1 Tax=Clostridium puniceum TaxID=29367 RepID=A0A1S8TPV0_9CLOT|nr:hypothetical protein CLPUN_14620 [Clostridium puniceum]
MKRFISTLINSRDLKRTIILSVTIVLALIVYFFYSLSDMPFVYNQF